MDELSRDQVGTRAGQGPTSLPPPRVVIASVEPEVDGGLHPIKRVVGETVRVLARVFGEGHDKLSAVLRFRRLPDAPWSERAMTGLPNDWWEATFETGELGLYEYTVEAWVNRFGTWLERLEKKARAAQDVASELLEGAVLVKAAAAEAQGPDRAWLDEQAKLLESSSDALSVALAPALREAMSRQPDRTHATRYGRVLKVRVERERARSGAWYEFFPRSCSPHAERHGSLRDCEGYLRYVAEMGFDVVYLPPIHPIGTTHRKGPNNTPAARPGDPGSPWAIGSSEGGHKSVHPELGTLDDFDRLVATARDLGLEIALDLAYQCSPDHPYVSHPEWFYRRPDGSIHYAENPPKKYQDIYPLNFESEQWRELWDELKSVVLFWIEHGVTIFRVDNPHTKPFAFWEWMIREVREPHPEVVFLSEAFTRPAVLQHLAKIGFSQSYTYFTWRNTKTELTEFFTEMSQSPLSEFLRPNLFANTPDILHEYLQTDRRAAFQIRLILAATLGASYGIYGPPFELCVGQAVPGTEEYQDSEKYQIRQWDLDRPGHIRDTVTRVNEIRRDTRVFTQGKAPLFLTVDNPQIIAYLRATDDLSEVLVVIVNLDPYNAQSGWLELPAARLGLDERDSFQVEDLLGGSRHLWQGSRNYVHLDPDAMPAHIFRLRRRVRTERDFDYFL